jgi:YVTN family beta-propeller protein
MMYRHNVSVFDRTGTKVASIADEVDLAAFGVDGGRVAQGSPVEAAFTPDGRSSTCPTTRCSARLEPGRRRRLRSRRLGRQLRLQDRHHDVRDRRGVIPTGAVPKFLAVSPDGSRLVVSNWCGFDVSIIDTATDTELARVDVGRHPRGVAIPRDSEVAYVTVMGEAKIVVIDLDSFRRAARGPRRRDTPRHIALSPDDRYLYVSNHR